MELKGSAAVPEVLFVPNVVSHGEVIDRTFNRQPSLKRRGVLPGLTGEKKEASAPDAPVEIAAPHELTDEEFEQEFNYFNQRYGSRGAEKLQEYLTAMVNYGGPEWADAWKSSQDLRAQHTRRSEDDNDEEGSESEGPEEGEPADVQLFEEYLSSPRVPESADLAHSERVKPSNFQGRGRGKGRGRLGDRFGDDDENLNDEDYLGVYPGGVGDEPDDLLQGFPLRGFELFVGRSGRRLSDGDGLEIVTDDGGFSGRRSRSGDGIGLGGSSRNFRYSDAYDGIEIEIPEGTFDRDALRTFFGGRRQVDFESRSIDTESPESYSDLDGDCDDAIEGDGCFEGGDEIDEDDELLEGYEVDLSGSR